MAHTHYSSEVLLAYYNGELAEPDAEDFHYHLATCAVCAIRARRARDSSGVSGAFSPETYARALKACPEEVTVTALAPETVAAFKPTPWWQRPMADMRYHWRPAAAWGLAVAAALTIGLLSFRLWETDRQYRLAQAQIATLSRAPLVNPLHDRSGEAGLTSSQLRLPVSGVPPEWLTRVQTLLSVGNVPPAPGVDVALAALQEVRQRGIGTSPEQRIASIRPVATAVKLASFVQFRWNAIAGVREYKFRLGDADDNPLRPDQTVRAAEFSQAWDPALAASSGPYSWQVQAEVNGTVYISDWEKFTVLDADGTQKVERMEQQFGKSSLLLTAVYETFGLYDDAAAQLDELASLNPGNAQVKAMQSGLQKLREPK